MLERLQAAAYDAVLALGEHRGMRARRRAVLAPLSGRVLEIGAGTGLNLAHYPATVTELVLTEPVAAMAAQLRRRARSAAPGRTVEIHEAPAERLPLPDASFDAVVSTLVLCTVPDPAAALGELRRVLRPGGRLVFVEHVRAEGGGLARAQDALAAPWRALAAGCVCNRPTLALLEAGGFSVGELRRERWRAMPPVVRPLVVGSAHPTEEQSRS